MKEFTRHNDKLGFDFSVANAGYYVSHSEQFTESAYGGADGFLASAADFYQKHKMLDTAQHFTTMASKFTKSASSAVRADFQIPDELNERRVIAGYLMEIEDLNLRLRRSEDKLVSAEQELSDNMVTIQGYNDSVVLSPHQVLDFPQQLRNNVRKVLDQLQTDDEKRYVKSLLDPFHPHSLGVRVPTRVPRNTITYNTHSEYTFKATANSQDIMYISNFEQMSGYYYAAVAGDGVQNFLTSPPVAIENAQVNAELDDSVHDVTVVPMGQKGLTTVSYSKDDTWHENFFKLRCVAGGTRVLKTSRQDSESGSLDMIYSRDGSSFDEGHAFKTDLARTRPDRMRTYLAGAGCCLRQTQGFVVQANKRPHDEASLQLLDVKKLNNSPGINFAPVGHTAVLWFMDISNKIMYPASEFDSIPNSSQIGIVLESLQ